MPYVEENHSFYMKINNFRGNRLKQKKQKNDDEFEMFWHTAMPNFSSKSRRRGHNHPNKQVQEAGTYSSKQASPGGGDVIIQTSKSRGWQKMSEKKFSEWGLPGVEIVGAPCESILHTTRPSQLPYNAKSKK